MRLLTELIDPVEYGELALGITIFTLFNQTFFGPLGNGATRFYSAAHDTNELRPYFTAVRQLLLYAMGMVLVLLTFTITGLFVYGDSSWVPLVTVSFFYAVVAGCNGIFDSIQTAARQRKVVALHQGMSTWLRYVFAAGAALWFVRNSTAAMLGFSFAIVLILFSQFHFLKNILPIGPATSTTVLKWRQTVWAYSWPFASWGLFTWAQLVSDRWALGTFSSNAEVGLYAVVFQLGYYPIAIFTQVCLQFISPIIFQRAGDASDANRIGNVTQICWRLTWSALTLTIVVFTLALYLHSSVFNLLVAEKYRSISFIWPWVLLSGGIFASSQVISLNLASQLKIRIMTKAKIFTALTGITLNFAGAYWFGIEGVVAALLFFSASIFLSLIIIAKHLECIENNET